MTEEQKIQIITPQVADDEIDLLQLVKTAWDGKKTIILSVVIFAVLGVFIALLSPKEYTASTTLVPQTSSKQSGLGGLSSLAAMAGFNLDMPVGGGTLSPVIYPQIVSSVPFQLELMNTPFTFAKAAKPVSIFEYYTEISKPGALSIFKKYTLGLPGVIITSLRGKKTETAVSEGSGVLSLTGKQEGIRKMLAESVTLEVNAKDGFLTLTANMPEALTAAQVAQKAQEMLQRYITEFKIAKASDQLQFIEGRYTEKKAEFERAQARLASFRDRNKNVTNAVARTEEDRLQSEFNIAYSVYSELAKQLEQAKIQVKEDTPVLSVIKPVVVPNERTKPKRGMILAIWVFLGGIVGVGMVFGKQYMATLREQWNQKP